MIKKFIGKYLNTISGLQAFQLIRFGSFFLISIIFTKSNLTTEAIGSFEIFLFLATLLCSFWINGLIQSFLPLFSKNNSFGENSHKKSPELFNAFLLITFLSLVVILILVFLKNPIAGLLNQTETIPYFYLLLPYIFLSCPAYLIEYIYLLKNKPGWILKYAIITFSVQVLLISAPPVFGYGMEYSIGGLVLMTGVRYIWIIALLFKYAKPIFSPAFISEHLKFGAPLIASALLASSAIYIDGAIVLNKFDTATFAIFRYGAKELPFVVLLANAFSTAVIPEFSGGGKLTEALKKLKTRSANMMHFLFPLTIVFLLTSNWLYPRIFNENFTESAWIFNIYLLLISSRLVFPHHILIRLKKTNIIMYASLAEFVVNATLSIIFIQFWGIEGVAFATVIAYILQKIIWIVYNKSRLKIEPLKYIPITPLVIYSIILAVVFIIMY
ncbi:MAG: polysaccharide biosynthesis C-terminal domain-containing protein [Prolixibacteraceae bacterium]|nr:polysaccharide biosynthesis C-terminal domain-containing protein [Prolixibacteraceae bacterium]